MTHVWEQFLTPQDVAALAKSVKEPLEPFGECRRPALLMIDFFRAAFGNRPQPLLEAMDEWPGSCGLAGWEALPLCQELLTYCRDRSIPVIHTTGIVEGDVVGQHAQVQPQDAPRPTTRKWIPADVRYEILPEVAPQPGETVIRKISSSAFWGTPLVGQLVTTGIDTVIVCGESTSGCVRASVVDARQYGFNVVVVEDGVFDRHEATHALNLFDMHRKFAHVLPKAEVLEALQKWEQLQASSAGEPVVTNV